MLKLRYDGIDNFSNEDGKHLLRRACLEFARNLFNVHNNSRILLIFESHGILDPLESDAIRLNLSASTTSDWINKFCALHQMRASVCKALNLFLNLDNDSDSRNYRAIIRRIFETLELPKRLEVINITPEQENQTNDCDSDTNVGVTDDQPLISHNQHFGSVRSGIQSISTTSISAASIASNSNIPCHAYALVAVFTLAAVIIIPAVALVFFANKEPDEDSSNSTSPTISTTPVDKTVHPKYTTSSSTITTPTPQKQFSLNSSSDIIKELVGVCENYVVMTLVVIIDNLYGIRIGCVTKVNYDLLPPGKNSKVLQMQCEKISLGSNCSAIIDLKPGLKEIMVSQFDWSDVNHRCLPNCNVLAYLLGKECMSFNVEDNYLQWQCREQKSRGKQGLIPISKCSHEVEVYKIRS